MPTIKINLSVSTTEGRFESLSSKTFVHAGSVVDVYKLVYESILAMPEPLTVVAPKPPETS